MTVLSQQSIRKQQIFNPFYERTTHEPTDMTYGCGAASYDVRLAEDLYLRTDAMSLASTMEHFSMPTDICGVVHDKSSLARIGILVQNTFIDPSWRGYLTLEITYHPLNATIGTQFTTLAKGTPIAQIVLHQLDQPTEQPYTGQYQDQPDEPVESKFTP